MLDLIEEILNRHKLRFRSFGWQSPAKKNARLWLMNFSAIPSANFSSRQTPESTGLNLQAANTVINVDLPWNPAVLEQRIARAHRMGQKNPVHVYLLVFA